MTINPSAAQLFIDGYKRVLLELSGCTSSQPKGQELYSKLVEARAKLYRSPKLLDPIATQVSLHDPSIVSALRQMSLRRWLYLRDTAHYSVFLDSENEYAYAVVGLTQRLRDLFGCSGLFVETVLPYADRYICDELFSAPIILGRNMLADARDLFSRIKGKGKFYRNPRHRIELEPRLRAAAIPAARRLRQMG